MKKYIFLAVLGVAFASFSPLIAKADEATTTEPIVETVASSPTVSVAPSVAAGGYFPVCYYIAAYSKEKCTNSAELQAKFIWNQSFHDYVIGHWYATWRVSKD